MSLLAVNGSPRGKEGNTERILVPFLEGIQTAGIKTETIYLKNCKINHCMGCFSCWTKTPGVCIHHDDMAKLLEKVLESEIIVYATPLYHFSVTGFMKDFLDRFSMPLLTPDILYKDGRYYHEERYPGKRPQKTVLISNCGFPGQYNFSGLCESIRLSLGHAPNATIVCSQGELLHNEKLFELLMPYFAAVRKAGQEMGEYGYITPETQTILDKDLIDPMAYIERAKSHWQRTQNGTTTG